MMVQLKLSSSLVKIKIKGFCPCHLLQVSCLTELTQTFTTFLPCAVRTTMAQGIVSDHTTQCSQCWWERLYSEETLSAFFESAPAFLNGSTSLRSLSNKARLNISTDGEWRLSAPWTEYGKKKATNRKRCRELSNCDFMQPGNRHKHTASLLFVQHVESPRSKTSHSPSVLTKACGTWLETFQINP